MGDFMVCGEPSLDQGLTKNPLPGAETTHVMLHGQTDCADGNRKKKKKKKRKN
jgi:hypothetical protein